MLKEVVEWKTRVTCYSSVSELAYVWETLVVWRWWCDEKNKVTDGSMSEQKQQL